MGVGEQSCFCYRGIVSFKGPTLVFFAFVSVFSAKQYAKLEELDAS